MLGGRAHGQHPGTTLTDAVGFFLVLGGALSMGVAFLGCLGEKQMQGECSTVRLLSWDSVRSSMFPDYVRPTEINLDGLNQYAPLRNLSRAD